MNFKNKYRVAILGAGAGGISVAAKLKRSLADHEIVIIDPASKHYYQPMWTLAGAGLEKKEDTEKEMKDLIPSGVDWIQDGVVRVYAGDNRVELSKNKSIEYDYLIVATGLKLNWDKIEGLGSNLGQYGICSIYDYSKLDYTAKVIQEFKGGHAIFVMPPVPIKCAGAPQKIMYLADNIFRNLGVREKSEIFFATAGKAMFGIPVFAEALQKQVDAKGITPLFQHKIVGVEPENQLAIFDVTDATGKVERKKIKYDLLHLVPTMSAHNYVSESGLAFADGDQKGWLEVDKYTLQHMKFKNIFGIGDVTGVPNSKTGAAIRMQYPIVVENLLAVMQGREPTQKYDGYSSCPLITEIGKVMLAEFGYDSKLLPTFPLDPAIPRASYWHLKTKLLPKLYWHGMLKGWV